MSQQGPAESLKRFETNTKHGKSLTANLQARHRLLRNGTYWQQHLKQVPDLLGNCGCITKSIKKTMIARYSRQYQSEHMEPLVGQFNKTQNIAVFVVQLKNTSHAHIVHDLDLTVAIKTVCDFQFLKNATYYFCHHFTKKLSAQSQNLRLNRWSEKNRKKLTKFSINFCPFSLLARTSQFFVLFASLMINRAKRG